MAWWKRTRLDAPGDAPTEPSVPAAADASAAASWSAPPGPRYYLYVSDAKLDMLAGQIPRSRLDRLAADLQIDMKVVAVSLRHEPSEETRYSKLALVEAYLLENGSVGTVDAPKAYFGGTLTLKWGVVAERITYFAGYSEQTALGLTGSPHHLLGQSAQDVAESGIGSFPSGVDRMARELDLDDLVEGDDADRVRSNVEGAAARFIAPAQEVHFLARRLMRAPASGFKPAAFRTPDFDFTMLGSPIYVALAD